MKLKALACVLILITLCCSQRNLAGDQVSDEVPDETKFVLVISLGQDSLNTLQKSGFLKTAVPEKMWNRIHSIRFRRPTSFLDTAFAVEARTDKRNRSLGVIVDESILDRLDYQPVEMKIYDSNYSNVVVVLERKKNQREAIPARSDVQLRAPDESPEFFIRIGKNRAIQGSLKNEKDLDVQTDFGSVQIALDRIAGIRFGGDESNSVFVVLQDGNRFSGTIEKKTWVVKSQWGEKDINVADLESITRNRNTAFVPDDANSKCWNLVTSSPDQPKETQNKFN